MYPSGPLQNDQNKRCSGSRPPDQHGGRGRAESCLLGQVVAEVALEHSNATRPREADAAVDLALLTSADSLHSTHTYNTTPSTHQAPLDSDPTAIHLVDSSPRLGPDQERGGSPRTWMARPGGRRNWFSYSPGMRVCCPQDPRAGTPCHHVPRSNLGQYSKYCKYGTVHRYMQYCHQSLRLGCR